MKERITYIDKAKGLLILGVVITHMSLQLDADAVLRTSSFSNVLSCIEFNTWVVFYMPAFFIITGLVSDFNKGFYDFILSTIIGLKMPVFFFIGILGALAIRPLFGFSPFDVKYWFIRLFESGVWFLHALFLAKIATLYCRKT